jgi:uncharacterized protein (TIGR03643 family)
MTESKTDISEIIEMAWCDKTSFDDIHTLTGLSESETIKLMRNNLKPSSFRLWRKRVSGRKANHKKIRAAAFGKSGYRLLAKYSLQPSPNAVRHKRNKRYSHLQSH